MKIILLFFSLLIYHAANAQHLIEGTIIDKKSGEAINRAQITLEVNGDITQFAISDSVGHFVMKNVMNGVYRIDVSCVGFYNIQDTIKISNDTKLHYKMIEDATTLDSLVVIGSRPRRETSKGFVYYLSKKARNSGDPYVALQEIPELVSNPVTQTVKLANGKPMVVLVDGMSVNTGITPIDPKRIESIEVINMVAAKYLHKGVDRVVNIRLKPESKKYIFLQAGARNDFPANKTMTWLSSEVGSNKLSFYYSVTASQDHDVKNTFNGWAETATYLKDMDGASTSSGKNISYDFMLKYKPNLKNDISLYFQGYNGDSSDNTKSHGTFLTNVLENEDLAGCLYRSKSTSKNLYKTFAGTLYYKYKFSNTANLESYITGTYNGNKLNNESRERYPTNEWKYVRKFNTEKTLIENSTDFEWNIDGISSFSASNMLKHTYNRLDEKSLAENVFRHKEWVDMATLGYARKIKSARLNCMVGYEGIWRWSEETFDHFSRFYLSTSATFNTKKYGTIGAYFRINSAPPSISLLNPYNTSTDSLYINKGNPHLKPQNTSTGFVNYSIYKKGIYVNASLGYTSIRDRFERIGYTNDDGIFVKTYKNIGSYDNIFANITAQLQIKNTTLQAYAEHFTEYYPGQKHRNSVILSAYAMQTLGKFTIQLQASYTNYSFTSISRTKEINPSCLVDISYMPSSKWMISIGTYSVFGNPRIETYTYSDGYKSFIRSKKHSFHPYITARWTIRKNSKKKIDIDNRIMRQRDPRINL